MINKVDAFIRQNKLLKKGDSVIAALSGGADSVCLLLMLAELRQKYGISLYAVHVNHGIRGEEARRDMEFAVALASEYGVECRVYNYDVPSLAKEMRMTEEETGRHVRYEAFEKERKLRDAQSIALAHHMNDQIETILFRMCRGTGIKGMQGIPVKRDNIIRPLMCLSREEIEEYLTYAGQEYVNDSTNGELDYDRNRVRNVIVPELEIINSQAVEHICRLSENISKLYEWYESECSRYYEDVVDEINDSAGNNRTEGSFIIKCDRLAKLPDIIASEIVRMSIGKLTNSLKDIENRHITAVLELQHMESGKQIHLPYSIVAERQYEYIRIYKRCDNGNNMNNKMYADTDNNSLNDKQEDVRIIETDALKSGETISETFYNVYLPEKGVCVDKVTISIRHNDDINMKNLPKNICTKWMDCDKMKGKLVIRRPKDSDYMYIDNSSRKKLSRYMIDNKIPRQYRNSLLILAEADNVLYIIGGRMGRRCYVDENSNHIIEINLIGV